MIKKILSFTIMCLLLTTANFSLVSAQTRTNDDASAAAKIKADVMKRGTGEKKRVKVTMNSGTTLKGYISQTGEDSFELTDSKTNQNTTIAYRDVAQVKGTGLSKGAKIGIGIGVAAGALAVVLGLLAKRICNEQAC